MVTLFTGTKEWDYELIVAILNILDSKDPMGLRRITRETQLPERRIRRCINKLLKLGFLKPTARRRVRGQQKPYKITDKGTMFLLSERLSEGVKQFVKDYHKFHEKFKEGHIKDYGQFKKSVEEPLMELLNFNMDKQPSLYDPYLVINNYPLKQLHKDAKLALKKGHYLTANHRFLLHKLDGIDEDKLIHHNIDWKKRIESGEYISFNDFKSLDEVNPHNLVIKEREARGLLRGFTEERIVFARNAFEFDQRWIPNHDELYDRWLNALKHSKHFYHTFTY